LTRSLPLNDFSQDDDFYRIQATGPLSPACVSATSERRTLFRIRPVQHLCDYISKMISTFLFSLLFQQRSQILLHATRVSRTLTPEEPAQSPCSSLHSADSQICMTRWRALYQPRRRKRSRTGVLLLPNTLLSHPFSPQFRDT
jgi:hypothetical protein